MWAALVTVFLCLSGIAEASGSLAMPSSRQLAVPTLPAGRALISKEAYDLIVQYECGGQVYYTSRLSNPTWPGGASGVTIGIGYDLGYNAVDQIRKDWAHLGSLS